MQKFVCLIFKPIDNKHYNQENMKLRHFLSSYKRLSNRLDDDALFCFVDEDEKTFGVESFIVDDSCIILQLGKIHNYSAHDLVLELENEASDLNIFARNIKTGKEYILQNRCFIEDYDICINMHEVILNEPSLEDAKKYAKDFGKEEQIEGVFTGKISNIAKKMGIKLVYIAYWLYYSLTSGNLSAKYITVVTGALGYLLCPLDIISDLIPFVGFTDDAAILMAAYYAIISSLTPENVKEITKKTKKAVRDIFGDFSDDDIKF